MRPTAGNQGSRKLIDVPADFINALGAVAAAAGINTDAAMVMAVGSARRATDATLASTETNIIPSTAVTLASSAGAMGSRSSAARILDGHTTRTAPFLNAATPDPDATANSTWRAREL
jgi:hypothetical protein